MTQDNKKVLLVEDDSAIIDVYSTAFKNESIILEVARTGAEAFDKVLESKREGGEEINLVLLDLILPDMNGAEVLRNIREGESTKDVPVFILSNQTSLEEQDGAVKPEKFLIKANVSPSQLVKIVQDYLNK